MKLVLKRHKESLIMLIFGCKNGLFINAAIDFAIWHLIY